MSVKIQSGVLAPKKTLYTKGIKGQQLVHSLWPKFCTLCVLDTVIKSNEVLDSHQMTRKDILIKRMIQKYQGFTKIGYVKHTSVLHYSFKNGCFKIRKILT